ncbi:MAG: hypothetical protein ACYDBQ_05090 [Thermoplasmatota archaeon]
MAGAWVANVSARNVGNTSLGVEQAYCVSGYGSWTAALSGPPGENLTYRDPASTALGCPGRSLSLSPGASWNWTSDAPCTTRSVCDNVWDLRLWDSSGRARPAPAGVYRWRFTFSYSDPPGMGGAASQSEGIDVTVNVPA